MVTDPIGDLVTRMRNAMLRNRESVLVPYSTQIEGIIKLLKTKTIIKDYKVMSGEKAYDKEIRIDFAFDNDNGRSVQRITGLERVSKPGRRLYLGYKDILKVRNGYGAAIVSSPKGIITDSDARKLKQGGEILFNVW